MSPYPFLTESLCPPDTAHLWNRTNNDIPSDDDYYWSDWEEWSSLDSTAITFLQKMGLPPIHPLCGVSMEKHDDTLSSLPPYSMNDLDTQYQYEEHFIDQLITAGYQILPALLAMAELWLRLFAIAIGPSIVVYFIMKELSNFQLSTLSNNSSKSSSLETSSNKSLLLIILGLASSIVLLTDTLYVSSYGRSYGGILLFLMIGVSLKQSTNVPTSSLPSSSRLIDRRRQVQYQRRIYLLIFISISFTSSLLLRSEGTIQQGNHQNNNNPNNDDDNDDSTAPASIFEHNGIDIPTIQPGFYVSQTNNLTRTIASLWPQESRMYNVLRTPYLPTGDSLTGIPFLVNSVPDKTFYRLWFQNPIDGEYLAFEIAFPPSGVHSEEKPVILILHGLNGGSNEDYVRDSVIRRTNAGHTCIIMIARGLMDTPVKGWDVFHGARITDIDTAAKIVKETVAPNQLVVGVGYSMGAIVLSNYVARSGKECHLDAAMSVSGGLDMREMLTNARGRRLWQPMLAQDLRDKFIIGKFEARYRQRLSKDQYANLMRARSVSEIDHYAVVVYNGYDDITHYYSDMSGMGDTKRFQHGRTRVEGDDEDSDEQVGRIKNVSIPFCVLNALDDPLTNWRVLGSDPEGLANTGEGNIMMLLTASGGHVGWPMGINPRSEGWRWMNSAVGDFVDSVEKAFKLQTHHY